MGDEVDGFGGEDRGGSQLLGGVRETRWLAATEVREGKMAGLRRRGIEPPTDSFLFCVERAERQIGMGRARNWAARNGPVYHSA